MELPKDIQKSLDDTFGYFTYNGITYPKISFFCFNCQFWKMKRNSHVSGYCCKKHTYTYRFDTCISVDLSKRPVKTKNKGFFCIPIK